MAYVYAVNKAVVIYLLGRIFSLVQHSYLISLVFLTHGNGVTAYQQKALCVGTLVPI